MRRLLQACGALILVVGGLTAYNMAMPVSAQNVAPQVADNPRIVSGADLGFRVTHVDKDGRPRGVLAIRVNGQWVDVDELPVARVIPAR